MFKIILTIVSLSTLVCADIFAQDSNDEAEIYDSSYYQTETTNTAEDYLDEKEQAPVSYNKAAATSLKSMSPCYIRNGAIHFDGTIPPNTTVSIVNSRGQLLHTSSLMVKNQSLPSLSMGLYAITVQSGSIVLYKSTFVKM